MARKSLQTSPYPLGMARWLLGIGNTFRRDDGLGPYLVGILRASLPPEVHPITAQVFPVPAPWHPQDRVLVLDAVHSLQWNPGTVVDLDLLDLPRLPQDLRVSTHGLGLWEWLRLTQMHPGLPQELRFLGIVGQDFGHGPGLSEVVARSVPEVLHRIRQWLQDRPTEQPGESVGVDPR